MEEQESPVKSEHKRKRSGKVTSLFERIKKRLFLSPENVGAGTL
jgi:hypothetical protein